MENFLNLAPALLFLAALLYISYWVQQQSSEARSSNFVKDYFIGGRSLGGFVLPSCRWWLFSLLWGSSAKRFHL